MSINKHFDFVVENIKIFVSVNVIPLKYCLPVYLVNKIRRHWHYIIYIKKSSEKKQILLLGDFNIDLLKCNDDNQVMSFLDIIGSHLVALQILLPTRITEHSKTLIDNILSSPTESGTISGNIVYSISDHLPQFCLFPSLDLSGAREDGPHFQKAWSKFNADGFYPTFPK